MARSTRNAHDSRKPNTFCKYILMQFFFYPFLFYTFTCQSRMFQMWLSFATAFTSASKSSDWTQKIMQIHGDLPLLTTDSTDYRLTVPTVPSLLEFKVMLYKVAQRQNTAWMNFECGEEKEREHLLIMQYKTERGYDCLAIHSTMAMNIRWTVADRSFPILQNNLVAWKQSLCWFFSLSPHTSFFSPVDQQEESLALTVIALPVNSQSYSSKNPQNNICSRAISDNASLL